MTYKEINPENWTYEKENDFIEGVLVKKQEDVGLNKSMLYSIETPTGVKNVWGATILDERMAFTKVGDKIKITYKGLSEKKAGKNPAKIFKVEKDED
jgi:predicted methyltransferase